MKASSSNVELSLIPEDKVGRQWGLNLYIGIYRGKNLENQLANKAVFCVEAPKGTVVYIKLLVEILL